MAHPRCHCWYHYPSECALYCQGLQALSKYGQESLEMNPLNFGLSE